MRENTKFIPPQWNVIFPHFCFWFFSFTGYDQICKQIRFMPIVRTIWQAIDIRLNKITELMWNRSYSVAEKNSSFAISFMTSLFSIKISINLFWLYAFVPVRLQIQFRIAPFMCSVYLFISDSLLILYTPTQNKLHESLGNNSMYFDTYYSVPFRECLKLSNPILFIEFLCSS